MGPIEELVAAIGIEIDDTALPKFNQSIIATTGKLAAFAGGAVAAASAVSAMLDAATETAGAVRFARSIDVAFGSLQRLEFAAQDVGVATGTVRGALDGLRRAARAAASGMDEGASAAFNHLRVNIFDANGELKKADRLLLDLADAVTNAADPNLALTLAEQLGLGTELNLLLRLGSDGIRGLGDEASRLGLILDEDAAKSSEKFAKGMDRLRASSEALLVQVGLPLVDWATDLLQRFQTFQKTEEGQKSVDLMRTTMSGLLKVVSLLAEPVRAFFGLFEKFGPIAVAALAPLWPLLRPLVLLVNPFTKVRLAILGILGAMNELRNFFEGNDSLLGRLFTLMGLDPDAIAGGISSGLSSGIDQFGNFIGNVGNAGRVVIPSVLPSLAAPAAAAGAGAPAAAGPVFNQQVDIHVNGNDNPARTAERVRRALRDEFREGSREIGGIER